MFKLLLIAATALVGLAHATPPPAARLTETADARVDPVRGNERGVYGTGTFFARPMRGRAASGLIVPTDEMHLVVGNFQDDTKYSGNTIDVSTLSRKIFTQVEQLDQDRHYLFDYAYAAPVSFVLTDTRYLLTGVRDAPEPAAFEATGLPTEFDVQHGRVGHLVRAAVANGRLVGVMRWNTFVLRRPICTFTLDMGGARRVTEGHVANETEFNIYSERGCRYVESLLPFGLEIKVNFSQNLISLDGPDHTAHSVVVDRIPGVNRRPVGTGGSSPIADDVLRDPEFQSGVRRLVDGYWSKHRAPAAP